MVEKKYSLISGCALDSALRAGPRRTIEKDAYEEETKEQRKTL